MRKLQADLDTKRIQRDELKEKQRLQKEGKVPLDGDEDGGDEDEGEDDSSMQGDDLFGESQDVGMDIS